MTIEAKTRSIPTQRLIRKIQKALIVMNTSAAVISMDDDKEEVLKRTIHASPEEVVLAQERLGQVRASLNSALMGLDVMEAQIIWSTYFRGRKEPDPFKGMAPKLRTRILRSAMGKLRASESVQALRKGN